MQDEIKNNNNKTAFITGASRGIGRAITLALAESGYNIAGVSRTMESNDTQNGLNKLRNEIESFGVSFLPLQMEISNIAKYNSVISEVIDRYGRIDLLVNNAGIVAAERMDILKTTANSYDEVMSVNLRGTFFLTQLISNFMISNKVKFNDYYPKIIFITSVSAEIPSDNRPEYCVSKAGLSMVSKLFAGRLASEGINVYEIRPGIIETDMTVGVKEIYDKLIAGGMIPQGRWGRPEDVAKVVAAIADGSFDYSTGSVIEVSGGMNIGRL